MPEGLIGAVDLGGTKILSNVYDDSLTELGSDLRPTLAELGPERVIDRIAESLRLAAAGRPIKAIGIATPGPCDPEKGIVTHPPNLPGWRDVPLPRLLGAIFRVPAWIENDANAAAIAEHRLGAGRGYRHMVLVTLGTGVGGGLVLNGQIYRGASGAAGEIGHMLIVPEGPRCGCGRLGCLEAVASGIAFERTASEIIAREPDGILARISRDEGREPSAITLEKAAAAGDATAIAAIKQAAVYLGQGLTNLVNVFNPEVIAVSGNLRKMDGFLAGAQEVVARDAMRQAAEDVRIVETQLGDDAGALGAALVAFDALARSGME